MNIVGYNGRYEINIDGDVFSNVWDTKKKMKGYINNEGYHKIMLGYPKRETFSIHRLVAYHFIENDDPDNKTHVHHINQKRHDNRIENLEWTTHIINNQSYNKGNNKNNTSGHKNISYDAHIGKKINNYRWMFQIVINRKRIKKRFQTKQEALNYKIQFLKNN